MYIYIYIYTCTYRERERDDEASAASVCLFACYVTYALSASIGKCQRARVHMSLR